MRVKPGQARENLSSEVLLRATGEKTGVQGVERAVIGYTQGWRVVLPLTAHKRL